MSNQPLDDKLDRFRHLIVGSPANKQPAPKQPARYSRLADAVGGGLIETGAGAFCVKRTMFPFDYRHGQCALSETTPCESLPVSAFTAMDEAGEVPLRNLVYLDTETTGLGGSGVVPFLVGLGRLTDEGLEISQYLIPDYPDETAMLEAIQPQLTDRAVVTYNGAAFDLPMLLDRFIINRIGREIHLERSIDLLQPTRRLFKRRLKDCSLGNVEREIFGFERTGDIPGYLVPSIYFDWLASERTDQLNGVLEHNLYDIVSLHFLAVHLGQTFRSEGASLKSLDDVYSLGRLFHRRRDRPRVRKLCDRLENESVDRLADDMRLFQGYAYKRANDWLSASAIFQELAPFNTREGYWASLELAKYFEHRAGDCDQALAFARHALLDCPCSRAEKDQLARRIARLTARSGR